MVRKGFALPIIIISFVALASAMGIGVLGGTIAHNKLNQYTVKDDGSDNEKSSVEKEIEIITGSEINLINANKDIVCTYVYESEIANSDGIVYIAGDKLYRKSVMQYQGGKSIDTYLIRDGEYSYGWGSFDQIGSKIKLVKTGVEGNTKTGSSNPLDQEIDYKCSHWKVDNSKFNPPSNIKFVDESENIRELCDEAPESSQQQCLDAFNGSN